MKKWLFFLALVLLCSFGLFACKKEDDGRKIRSTSSEISQELALEEVIIGKWITTVGTADSTARIYKFYSSGIANTWIGDESDNPMIGCWVVEGDKLYFNSLNRDDPKAFDPLQVEIISENEVTVSTQGKVITWKRYE